MIKSRLAFAEPSGMRIVANSQSVVKRIYPSSRQALTRRDTPSAACLDEAQKGAETVGPSGCVDACKEKAPVNGAATPGG